MKRKLGFSISSLRPVIERISNECTMILPLSINTLYVGLSLSERYGFSHFDSLIVASALEAGCSKLYSEDMRNGLLVNQRVKDSDPFLL